MDVGFVFKILGLIAMFKYVKNIVICFNASNFDR